MSLAADMLPGNAQAEEALSLHFHVQIGELQQST